MSFRQTTLTGTGVPAAAPPQPPRRPRNKTDVHGADNANAWMEALWELHCGSPLAGAVRYTDPIVEAMWEVFQPLVGQLDVYPLSIPETTPEFIDASTAATVAFTDFIVLSLVDPTANAVAQDRRRTHGHRADHPSTSRQHTDDVTGDEDGSGESLGNPLTPVMRSALLDQPKIVLALLEFFTAVWLYQYEARRTSSSSSSSSAAPALRRVYAAVSGDVRHATAFDHLGAAQLGRLLTIKGTIVRMSPTRIACLRMAYRCGHCGAVKEQATEDGVLTYPGPCATSRCRGYKWVPLTEQAVCEEVQLLRLQEHTTFFDASPVPNASSGRGGSSSSNSGMHVMIEVELRPPWLDAVTVGDGVCVCGILETRRSEGKQSGGMQQVCLRARAIHGLRNQGNSASSSGSSGAGGCGAAVLQHRLRTASSPFASVVGGMGVGGGGLDDPWRLTRNGSSGGLSGLDPLAIEDEGGVGGDGRGRMHPSTSGPPLRDAAAILTTLPGSGLDGWSAEETGRYYEMARHPQWFARLTASVAPFIFGMELVKQALLLAIVGGNRDKNDGETRSSIHLLLVGDPGLGKSQLLRAACAVAPRSAFVCTHTSSSCGLTMTLTRDPVSGETTFEAGAVVHGDGGITCLDEIDKGVQEHKALLEVMEQETVSLAKAGMIFSMPVHTSVLAAGNPIGGSFDISKSLAANVNLSPALMSRFDIIACLRNPHGTSGAAQQALMDHVLQWHRHGTSGSNSLHDDGSEERGRDGNGGRAGHRHAASLPLSLVRRFLMFCRSQCQPTLCREACDVLQAHYLAQRQHLPEPQYGFPAGEGGRANASSVDGGRLSDGSRGISSYSTGATSGVGLSMEGTVTPRYLQALIRVSEARAKLELRHEVTRDDAEYAVWLLQSCLHSFDGLAAPGSAAVGATGAGGGSGGGRKPAKLNQRDAVLQRLKEMIVAENRGTNLFTEQTILDVCEAVGCRSAPAMFRQLSEFGFLLQKGGSTYCLRGC
jgi:DNA replicative helicase MCM subunit Mcm2 (Cdc46/Mcm family)